VFSGAVVDTGPSIRARSSLSFLFVAREGKGLGTSGLGMGGHGRIVFECHGYPLVNLVSMCVYDRGFEGWGRERPVKQWATGVSPRFSHRSSVQTRT
jgi:hypothetical protein